MLTLQVKTQKSLYDIEILTRPRAVSYTHLKIALSLKFPEANPWLTAAEDFAVGNVVKGKVAVIRKPFIRLNHFIEKRMEDTEML